MSYIPRSSFGKNGTPSTIPRVVRKKRTFRIFGFIGTTILLLSVVGTGGVFFLKNVSSGQLDQAKLELESADAQAAGNRLKINEIKKYDNQLTFTSTLLKNHLAPSKLFEALELGTTETVQYKTFEYEYDPGFEAVLTLGGGTKEFTSVVLQKMQLVDSTNSPFEVALVEDITKVEEGADVLEGQQDTASYGAGQVSFTVQGLLKEGRFVYTGQDVVVKNEASNSAGQAESNNESIGNDEESNPDNI